MERLSNEVVGTLGTRGLQGRDTHSPQFRRDVSSFISQHTCATRALNPSRVLPARNETDSRKQNILFPDERASRQQPADFSSHFRLFGYGTYVRPPLFTDGSRDICTFGFARYLLSPACHPIATQTRQTLTLQPDLAEF